MKKFVLLLLLAAFAVSCTSTLPGRFDRFVSSVEKHGDSYSRDDWAKANEKFTKFVNEYKDNRSAFNSDQKKTMNSAIARYAAAAAKSGFKEIATAVDGVVSQIPDFIEGAIDFFKSLGIGGTGTEE